MMLSVRPVGLDDVGAVLRLAAAAGPGMSTLPCDPDAVAALIEQSCESFAGHMPDGGARYTLVLTDGQNDVLGIASVIARAGTRHGFYSYKRNRLFHSSSTIGRSRMFDVLTLSNDYTGTTEVGTLFLHPSARRPGIGRFLALSRYMLIGQHPKLFSDRVMAEMRGWQRADGTSPFWDNVGARFFDMPFDQADRTSALFGNHFIAEMLPKHPIYVELLGDEARSVIGKPHVASAPAMKMLSDEGFAFEDYVDVFDAGPTVHAPASRIRCIREARVGPVQVGAPSLVCQGEDSLIANPALDRFRVCRGNVVVGREDTLADAAVLRSIGAEAGDTLRIAPLRPRDRSAFASATTGLELTEA